MLQRQLDYDKPSDPTYLSVFRSALAEKLRWLPSQNTTWHWSLIKDALYSVGLMSCGLIRRVVTPGIYAGFLRHLQDRLSQ